MVEVMAEGIRWLWYPVKGMHIVFTNSIGISFCKIKWNLYIIIFSVVLFNRISVLSKFLILSHLWLSHKNIFWFQFSFIYVHYISSGDSWFQLSVYLYYYILTVQRLSMLLYFIYLIIFSHSLFEVHFIITLWLSNYSSFHFYNVQHFAKDFVSVWSHSILS